MISAAFMALGRSCMGEREREIESKLAIIKSGLLLQCDVLGAHFGYI